MGFIYVSGTLGFVHIGRARIVGGVRNVHRQAPVDGVVGEMIADPDQRPAIRNQSGIGHVLYEGPIGARRRVQRRNRTVIINDCYRELGWVDYEIGRGGNHSQQHRLFPLYVGVLRDRHRHSRRTNRLASCNSQINIARQSRIIISRRKRRTIRQIQRQSYCARFHAIRQRSPYRYRLRPAFRYSRRGNGQLNRLPRFVILDCHLRLRHSKHSPRTNRHPLRTPHLRRLQPLPGRVVRHR